MARPADFPPVEAVLRRGPATGASGGAGRKLCQAEQARAGTPPMPMLMAYWLRATS